MNRPHSVLLIAGPTELPREARVWGTGGWIEPREREALDWLTLCRLLGWDVTVGRTSDEFPPSTSDPGWIIVACDPDELSEQMTAWLASILNETPKLLVARAGSKGSPISKLSLSYRSEEPAIGSSLAWIGPGSEQTWLLRKDMQSSTLAWGDKVTPWATLERAPVITARRVGDSTVVTLGFHPSEARDCDGSGTALLRLLLVRGSRTPVAWWDLEGTLVLRMDDPGGSQNIFSSTWSYPKLHQDQWAQVGAELTHRDARLSLGYVSGWVDDGDAARGELTVGGEHPERTAGQIHPSPLVIYRDTTGHRPSLTSDYESEFAGIQELRDRGLAEVELHGFTHINPDRTQWASAADRYDSESWYRELGSSATGPIAALPLEEHPLNQGVRLFDRFFGVHPTTLISPGDEWTDAVLERALDLDLVLVSSYYLALRHESRFCWAMQVCSPYLDVPDAAWFDSGLPVIGYFHDRELALDGIEWMGRWLDEWRGKGARRFRDLRELAAILDHRLGLISTDTLLVERCGRNALVRNVPVKVYFPEEDLPSRLSVDDGSEEMLVTVEQQPDGSGLILLDRRTVPMHRWRQRL